MKYTVSKNILSLRNIFLLFCTDSEYCFGVLLCKYHTYPSAVRASSTFSRFFFLPFADCACNERNKKNFRKWFSVWRAPLCIVHFKTELLQKNSSWQTLSSSHFLPHHFFFSLSPTPSFFLVRRICISKLHICHVRLRTQTEGRGVAKTAKNIFAGN